MTVLDLQVSASSDDVSCVQNNTIDATGGTVASVDLNIYGTNNTAAQPNGNCRDAATRFLNVTIPQGATIDTAYWEFNIKGDTRDDLAWDTYAEDVDNAATWAGTEQIYNRTRTTASVAFVATAAGIGWVGSTIDIKTVIQEIVDRAGWASGNAIDLIHIGRISLAAATTMRADTYDSSTTLAPKLHIEYTAGGGAPVLTAEQSGANIALSWT